ncbi:MAG: alpha-ketoacid dehydrogenase subunit beta [Planctomycetota bacterium]|nr:alpha-ketoacid dehydrogenase subunit beta [Planctomycetota bacterium]MDA1142221.1 alpha-ketoacid dehydrogenase subunit beta [Planctomycetota bacterium]
MPEIFYSHAVRDALREEMQRDERVFILGEDIVHGGAFGVTKDMASEFGTERIRNTPVAEEVIVGAAIGAALLGSRPVVEIMFMDFCFLAFDQLFNHGAKYRFMYGDPVTVPMVLRTPAGARRGYGPTHSQSLDSIFMSIPGVKVVVPSNGYDAKGLLKTAIRDNNPVVFIENKTLYGRRCEVPSEDYTIPFGQARIVREGSDCTVVATGQMVEDAMKAAQVLSNEGIEIEVIDPRTLNPLDMDTICESVSKTAHLVVAEEGHLTGGVGAEIGMRVVEECFYDLDGPVRRVAAKDIPVPCSEPLEQYVIPGSADIIRAVRESMVEE